jgi:hypothetical protein
MTLKNVVALPASATMSAEQALLSALEFTRENNLTDVLIAGYDADGVLIVRSSRMTRAEALFMLEKAKEWAMTP